MKTLIELSRGVLRRLNTKGPGTEGLRHMLKQYRGTDWERYSLAPRTITIMPITDNLTIAAWPRGSKVERGQVYALGAACVVLDGMLCEYSHMGVNKIKFGSYVQAGQLTHSIPAEMTMARKDTLTLHAHDTRRVFCWFKEF